jgi:hypothetical protein
MKHTDFAGFEHLRETLPSADQVDRWIVFNVCIGEQSNRCCAFVTNVTTIAPSSGSTGYSMRWAMMNAIRCSLEESTPKCPTQT